MRRLWAEAPAGPQQPPSASYSKTGGSPFFPGAGAAPSTRVALACEKVWLF